MTTEIAAPPSTGSLFLTRLARWSDAVVQSAWTPIIVAVHAMLVLTMGASGAILQTRLAEIADQNSGSPDSATFLQGGPAAAQTEFTLAPEAVRPISMDEARVWNAGLPFSSLPILAARPFIMPPEGLADYARALDCLTAAVYYEAASETGPGQAAVAQVVLNRMRHPAFPKTVCGVVFQGQERTTGCQFSFTCDGALARIPSAAGWARARAVAAGALNGFVATEVGMATHYHTDWVAPYWAERLVKMRQIGTHIFYRWTGGWGLPGAFRGVHAGAEPVIEKLAALATYVETPAPELVDIPVVDLDLPLSAPLPNTVVEASTAAASLPTIVAEAPVIAPTPPPAAPAVLANPMAPVSATVPQRRTRIATPR